MNNESRNSTAVLDWGWTPERARDRVRQVEWENRRNLKGLMTGIRAFPLHYSLKLPSGKQAMSSLSHLEGYVSAWRNFSNQEWVEWEEVSYRDLKAQRLPSHLVIPDMSSLIAFLGEPAQRESRHWESVMHPILQDTPQLYETLVSKLELLSDITAKDSERISKLLPQLERGIGKAQYLRALPIAGIDTKFIENNFTLVESLMDSSTKGEVMDAGGLMQWLNCTPRPANWITARPLCDAIKQKMGGYECLQISGNNLIHKGVPGRNLLIVENLESGFGLPELPDTVAIIGCGKNLSWMDNPWIHKKRVAYWGDIDSWGMQMLDNARSYCPELVSLMMDESTIQAHLDQMGAEQKFVSPNTPMLNAQEKKLLQDLLDHKYPGTRLEQERLCQDFIVERLQQWVQ